MRENEIKAKFVTAKLNLLIDPSAANKSALIDVIQASKGTGIIHFEKGFRKIPAAFADAPELVQGWAQGHKFAALCAAM